MFKCAGKIERVRLYFTSLFSFFLSFSFTLLLILFITICLWFWNYFSFCAVVYCLLFCFFLYDFLCFFVL